jgi:hypothetical protein
MFSLVVLLMVVVFFNVLKNGWVADCSSLAEPLFTGKSLSVFYHNPPIRNIIKYRAKLFFRQGNSEKCLLFLVVMSNIFQILCQIYR